MNRSHTDHPAWGRAAVQREVQPLVAPWTTSRCPRDHNHVSRELGIIHLSHVEPENSRTLQRRGVVPNPQDLLLTLPFDKSLHEEKCPR